MKRKYRIVKEVTFHGLELYHIEVRFLWIFWSFIPENITTSYNEALKFKQFLEDNNGATIKTIFH